MIRLELTEEEKDRMIMALNCLLSYAENKLKDIQYCIDIGKAVNDICKTKLLINKLRLSKETKHKVMTDEELKWQMISPKSLRLFSADEIIRDKSVRMEISYLRSIRKLIHGLNNLLEDSAEEEAKGNYDEADVIRRNMIDQDLERLIETIEHAKEVQEGYRQIRRYVKNKEEVRNGK